VPLLEQRPLGLRAGAQPEGVADDLLHTRHHPVHPRHFPDRAGDRPRGVRRTGRARRRTGGDARPRAPARVVRPAMRYPPAGSNRSRAARRGCSVRSSGTRGPGCPRSGLTRTSSPRTAAPPWRSSSAMSRTHATPRALPHLPMAEARGFSGAF
jgi:hypothetical protein